jgi:hypothetical protein
LAMTVVGFTLFCYLHRVSLLARVFLHRHQWS